MTLFPREKRLIIGQIWSCSEACNGLVLKATMNHFSQASHGKKDHQFLLSNLKIVFQPDEDEHVLYVYPDDCGGACKETVQMIINDQTGTVLNMGHFL